MKKNRPIRVLFLTRYPMEGASSRYRVFQYLPHLKNSGVEATVQSFMNSSMYKMMHQPGRTFKKAVVTIFATLKRIQVLWKWQDYDILYMQRELFPFGPPVVERFLKARGAVIFFDYDDALFIKKASRYNPIATLLRSPGKTLEMFRIADCTVAGNNWLRDIAIKEGGRSVTLEVAEDTKRYRSRDVSKNTDEVTIGWLGSPSTVKYLSLIKEPLQKIAIRYPEVKWEIIGGNDFVMQGVPWTVSEWSLDAEVEGLARFDIGLMPLPLDEWSNGKSGGKARTYMAAGVVPVCTAIGYNLELIKQGETGLLCSDSDQWLQALCELIDNSVKRDKIAQDARHNIGVRFSPMLQAQSMQALFIEFLETKGGL